VTTGEGRAEAAPPRLFGVDAARGLALLGMFIAHTYFVGPEKIVDGRSAILFATVAGVSLGLLSGRAHPPLGLERVRPRLVILARGTALVVIGVALTTLLNPPIAVILDYYGFGFLVLLSVLFLPRAVLGGIALVLAFIAPPVVAAITGAVTFEQIPDALQLFARWLFYGEYPMFVWFAFLLAGLVLARSDLGNRLTAGVAVATGTLCAIAGYGSAHLIPGATAAAHSDSTAEVFGSGGVAIAVIGILSLLDSAGEGTTGGTTRGTVGGRISRVLQFVLAPVAAAGSMALTLYTAHAILLAIVRNVAMDHGRWEMPPWVLPVLIVGSLVFATVWRRLVGTGPLEAALRAFANLVSRTPRPKVAP
jgi:uncharacterized membrane protein YeiB